MCSSFEQILGIHYHIIAYKNVQTLAAIVISINFIIFFFNVYILTYRVFGHLATYSVKIFFLQAIIVSRDENVHV